MLIGMKIVLLNLIARQTGAEHTDQLILSYLVYDDSTTTTYGKKDTPAESNMVDCRYQPKSFGVPDLNCWENSWEGKVA